MTAFTEKDSAVFSFIALGGESDVEIIDELKEKFNMSESKRRSHVGMDVAFWQAGGLGILEVHGVVYTIIDGTNDFDYIG